MQCHFLFFGAKNVYLISAPAKIAKDFYFSFFHFFALSHIIPIANLCDSRSCSFCFYFFKIGGGVGEEDAVQVIHFVLENLGEQTGSAAGKFFYRSEEHTS